MQNTAQPLLAYRISGKPFDLGLIGFAVTLPTFFLALPSGVLIERWDKRKAVMILQAVMLIETLALALLTLAGLIQIWHIVLLSLILGTATTFEITARQSMLIEIVGREHLPNAIALQSTAFNISRVLGPALVAPVLLFIPNNGEGWIFLANSISFGAIIVSLFFVRLMHKPQTAVIHPSFVHNFLEGGRYIRAHKGIAAIILIAAIMGLFGLPVMQQIPVLAQDILSKAGDAKSLVDARNSALYGSLGLGALVAAVTVALNNSEARRGTRLLVGQGAFICGLMGIAFTRELWRAVPLIALIGWGSVTQFTMLNTLLQTKIDDQVRGRVFSMYLWAFQGIAPFGSLLIGWMTQAWTLPVTALACGAICLFGVGVTQLRYPEVRNSSA